MTEKWVPFAAEVYQMRFGREVGAAPSTMAELISQIDRVPFLNDLLDCRAAAPDRAGISATGVRNLLNAEKHPVDLGGKSLAFIHYYLEWLHLNHAVPLAQEAQWKALHERLRRAVLTSPTRRVSQHPPGVLSFARSNFFDYLFDKVSESSEERDIFFSQIFGINESARAASYANTAYYAGFRFSTLEGRIVKSFLALLTPAENRFGFFSFVHVVKGDVQYNQLKKVTRGIVINLSPATYFLGRTLRDDAETVPNFEMLAIERDAFLARRPIIHALQMSSAAVNRPIVSRIVFFRVGDRSSLGRKLSDEDINATEFDSSKLLSELKALLEKCNDLGVPTQLKTTNSKTLNDHAMALERLVRDGINNIPRPALARALREGFKSKKGSQSPISDGAIETWGKEPRP